MSFADSYLQKHAVYEALITEAPHPDLNLIIAIPAFEESGLQRCLDSLFLCDDPGRAVEIILLVNQPENAREESILLNTEAYKKASEWAENHQKPGLKFHPLYIKELPSKHFGAGLARKTAMDEALRRFNILDRPGGIIASLDADTTVERSYLQALEKHYSSHPGISGCTISFSHPKAGTEFTEDIYQAISLYERHLDYYLEAVRHTGYPYAFHTIGSAFSVKASAYASAGGMSKRQAGEDFYFIQKLAVNGNFSECKSTCVYPSPRISKRVPFGTGPEVEKIISSGKATYETYNPVLFEQLRQFYVLIPDFYRENSVPGHLADHLLQYLEESNFASSLDEIKSNVASEPAFRKRFFQKFNMFWILKYLHFCEARGIPRMELDEAADLLLSFRNNFGQSSAVK